MTIDFWLFRREMLVMQTMESYAEPVNWHCNFSITHNRWSRLQVGPHHAAGRGLGDRAAPAGTHQQLHGGLHHGLLHRWPARRDGVPGINMKYYGMCMDQMNQSSSVTAFGQVRNKSSTQVKILLLLWKTPENLLIPNVFLMPRESELNQNLVTFPFPTLSIDAG